MVLRKTVATLSLEGVDSEEYIYVAADNMNTDDYDEGDIISLCDKDTDDYWDAEILSIEEDGTIELSVNWDSLRGEMEE